MPAFRDSLYHASHCGLRLSPAFSSRCLLVHRATIAIFFVPVDVLCVRTTTSSFISPLSPRPYPHVPCSSPRRVLHRLLLQPLLTPSSLYPFYRFITVLVYHAHAFHAYFAVAPLRCCPAPRLSYVQLHSYIFLSACLVAVASLTPLVWVLHSATTRCLTVCGCPFTHGSTFTARGTPATHVFTFALRCYAPHTATRVVTAHVAVARCALRIFSAFCVRISDTFHAPGYVLHALLVHATPLTPNDTPAVAWFAVTAATSFGSVSPRRSPGFAFTTTNTLQHFVALCTRAGSRYLVACRAVRSPRVTLALRQLVG